MNYCIVTNSYRRPLDLVERSLRYSLAQIPVPAKVVFIDQNVPPLELSSEIRQNPRLEHLKIPVNSVSLARNSFELPMVDWLVFCDDDGHLDTNYAATLEQILKDRPSLKIIAGSIRRDDNGDFYTPRHKMGGDLQKFRHTKLLMGSNFAVRPETFKLLGGFDEKFGAGAIWGSGEETDFAWKAYFAQIPMEYRPELVVHHIRPYAGDWKHSCNKAYRYGLGKGALTAKWLVGQRKTIIFLEILEMLSVPFLQMAGSLLRLKWSMIPVYGAALWGRMTGFLRYLINRPVAN